MTNKVLSGVKAAVFFTSVLGASAALATPITDLQTAQVYDGYDSPAPGVYKIRYEGTFCLKVTAHEGTRQFDYLSLGGCDGAAATHAMSAKGGGGAWTQMAVVPLSTGDALADLNRFTVRPVLDGNGWTCASLATNVIIGPPSIDSRYCLGGEDTAKACGLGREKDQVMTISADGAAGNLYRISPPGADAKGTPLAWTLRAGSPSENNLHVNTEIVGVPSGERFEFIEVGPVSTRTEMDCITRQGWVRGPDGMRRAQPTAGVDLRGNELRHFPTDDDGGRACAQQCATDAKCSGYTWSKKGTDGAATAMCSFKNAFAVPVFGKSGITWAATDLPTPTQDANRASGVVRHSTSNTALPSNVNVPQLPMPIHKKLN